MAESGFVLLMSSKLFSMYEDKKITLYLPSRAKLSCLHFSLFSLLFSLALDILPYLLVISPYPI